MGVATQTQTRSTAAAAQVSIPAFGNWDCYYANGTDDDGGIPITQYFDSARAAGLRRGQQQYPSFRKDYGHYSCCHHHSGHQLPPYLRSYHYQYCNQKRLMMMRNADSHEGLWWEQRRPSEEKGPLMVRQQLQRRRNYHCDYTHQDGVTATRKQTGRTTTRLTAPAGGRKKTPVVSPAGNRVAPKAVDEDLYKIPSELLRLHQKATTRRRSILRAWRCMGIHCIG